MKLQDLLYSVPIIGGIKHYRELKEQNLLLERKIPEEPDLGQYTNRHPLRAAISNEIIYDIYHAIGGGIALFAYSTLDTDFSQEGKLIEIVRDGLFSTPLITGAIPFIGRICDKGTQISRAYKKIGKATVKIPLPLQYKTVEINSSS